MSAYVFSGGEGPTADARARVAALLPHAARLPSGTRVELDVPRCARERAEMHAMLAAEVDAGTSYPNTRMTEADFAAYFLSCDAFLVRAVDADDGVQGRTAAAAESASASASASAVPAAVGETDPGGEVLGCFYVKPNFPGRCSHICNGGFITKAAHRSKGVGWLMTQCFLDLTKLLGYRAAMFNLVFDNNEASLRLWRRAGFREIGVIPGAGLLADGAYHDAHMQFYDLTEHEVRLFC